MFPAGQTRRLQTGHVRQVPGQLPRPRAPGFLGPRGCAAPGVALLRTRCGMPQRSPHCRAGPAEDRHWLCVAAAIAGIPGTLGTLPKDGGKQIWMGQGRCWVSKKWRGPCRLVVWVGEEGRGSSPEDVGVPPRERGHENSSKQSCVSSDLSALLLQG